MMNKRLIIDGKEIDLGEAVIATSYQLGDIGDLTTRRTNYSNQFNVPASDNNIKNLGFSNLEKSGSDVPYKKSPAQLLNRGLNIMPYALAEVTGANKGFNIELYSGAKAFFDSLGDKTLEDLTPDNDTNDYYSGHDGGFYNAYIVDSLSNDAANPLADDRRLVMKYKSIVDRIIAAAGYTKQGTVFTDPKLDIMSMYPLGDKGLYNTAFKKEKEFDAYHAGSVVSLTNVYQNLSFTNVVKESIYYDNVDTYTEKRPISTHTNLWYKHKFYITIEVTAQANVVGAVALQMQLFQNGVGLGTFTAALGFFPQTYTIVHGPLDAGNNQPVNMCVKVDAGTADLTFSTKCRMYNEVQNTILNPTLYKSFHGLMPIQIKQKDFIKDFAFQFGILFTEQNNVLIAKTLKEIIQDKAHARDWTSKRDHSVEDGIGFNFAGKYAQSNIFKYQSENDGVDETVGQGNLTVPNTNLENTKDYYTSMFTNSKTFPFGNGTAGYINCANIPTADEAKLRLLMVRDNYSSEPTIAGGVSSYKVAYFEDAAATYDCTFAQVISYSYTEIKAALVKAKVVDRKYMLNVIDINLLDLLFLVYDNGSYYLVNKVSNYIADKKTSVQLFKVV